LVLQIAEEARSLCKYNDISVTTIFGGMDYEKQRRQLDRTTNDIIVATPGRLLDFKRQGQLRLDQVEVMIIDEADRMLDMGFFDDIMKIVQYLPKKRQNLLFAATMPAEIRKLAKKILHQPAEINIAISKPADKVLQVAYVVYETQKLPLVTHLLKGRDLKSVIVFCSTKLSAKQLGRQLKREGLQAQDIHSDLDQKAREEIMLDFRNRKLNILVATDLLSRGIDVDNIELIINYDVPHEGEDYIHRIGRTARAESDGIAITLISEQEQYKFARIEKLLEQEVTKSSVPEEFGETPDYNPAKNRGRGGRPGGGRSGGGRPGGGRSGGGRSGGGYKGKGSGKKPYRGPKN
jgi:superfamily II DNA/RNA helicase